MAAGEAAPRGPRGGRRLAALSLARRAGKLAVGFDAAVQKARRREAALVLLAADASENSRARAARACGGRCPVRLTALSKDDIGRITHKAAGILAITDKDMAVLFERAANEEEAD